MLFGLVLVCELFDVGVIVILRFFGLNLLVDADFGNVLQFFKWLLLVANLV